MTAILAFAMVLGFLSAASVIAKQHKVDVCHVDEDGVFRKINISVRAVTAHIAHGDEIGIGEACSDGIGVCRADGEKVCTQTGLICDAIANEPQEQTEVTCDDGKDNDCDGFIDAADEDCMNQCDDYDNCRDGCAAARQAAIIQCADTYVSCVGYCFAMDEYDGPCIRACEDSHAQCWLDAHAAGELCGIDCNTAYPGCSG